MCSIVLLLLSGCASDKALESLPVNIDTVCIPNGYTVTYTGDIKMILETYCTDPGYGSCHQSGSDYDYTYYLGIKAEAEIDGPLEDQVLKFQTMPPPNSMGPKDLTDCELQKLSEWIYNWAPE
ncbi:MAG: hypothetical protein H0V61_09935 [Chitinophagales bacterium]|jgi:hypothetical protein|nr:hypothetical protein [Chitinophagales bacterium]